MLFPFRGLKLSFLLSFFLVAVLVCASCEQNPVKPPVAPGQYRLWPNSTVPAVAIDPDGRPIVVGTEFTPGSDGKITAARFYQANDDARSESATLWSAEGGTLATVSIPSGPSGWREVRFDSPVSVTADRNYVISYRASDGIHASSAPPITRGNTIKSGWLTAFRSVFTTGDGIPDQPGDANYFVDVVFESGTPTLRNVDGGARYYDSFTNSFPTSPDFFPIAVWSPRVVTSDDVSVDRSVGLNTYVQLTPDSVLNIVKDGGMLTIDDNPKGQRAGNFLTDEADMWAGAGDAPWNGHEGFVDDGRQYPCLPPDAGCGFTAMAEFKRRSPSGVLSYANYGKGVTFWLPREQSERFVNDYQNLVSADNYWFADDIICGQNEGGKLKNNGLGPLSPEDCHLAANYGITTRYVRSLVRPPGALPVWNFVEIGHPSGDEEPRFTITGPQMRASVWSSIINGARGIIYFAANFGGPCQAFYIIRDVCGDDIRGDLKAVNEQIRRLAPVLNAPFVDGYARSDGPIDLAVKRLKGSNYILAGSTSSGPTDATIVLSCGDAQSIEVVDENRRIDVRDNTFRDSFKDGNAIHIYRVDDTADCGLPE
jgi:hypothetical protein